MVNKKPILEKQFVHNFAMYGLTWLAFQLAKGETK